MTIATASQNPEERARLRSIAFLNWAHAIDHFVLLIYPTVVIGLEVIYRRPYSELIALSSAAFVAFGISPTNFSTSMRQALMMLFAFARKNPER